MKWSVWKICTCLALALCAVANADVKLAPIFSDHMVLQRNQPLPVWGTASPDENIIVTLANQRMATRADAAGRWRITLEALPNSVTEPLQLSVDGKLNTVVIRDILPGEVWLCSGQSNMSWMLRAAMEGAKEVKQSDFPQIRYFKVARRASEKPEDEALGRWVKSSPESSGEFSAVPYFFARELYRTLKVPVGIIDTSFISPNSEAWADIDILRFSELTRPFVERFEAGLPAALAAYPEYVRKLEAYRKAAHASDPGDAKSAAGWHLPNFDDSGWQQHIPIPARFDDGFDGAIWFRRDVEIPQNWAGKDLVLSLGTIDDSDITWFNGQKIGSTARELSPTRRHVERLYVVPGAVVKPGRNVIAVRAFDMFSTGGMLGPADLMSLQLRKNPDTFISLGSEWKQAIEIQIPLRAGNPVQPLEPPTMGAAAAPGSLFNGTIRPLAPFALKGVAIYDGEMNVSRAYAYRGTLAAEIQSIRRTWNAPDLPALIVQAANFRTTNPSGKGSALAELRESQFYVARTLPHCALAVTIDIGDPADIHPTNKQDVGKRLSLAALKTAYNSDIFSNGPIYKSFYIEDSTIRVSFEATKCQLDARGGTLLGFEIAGDDQKFLPATATIAGQSVIVSNRDVPAPVAVRYAWADSPEATLYNSENLPAIPFRTDSWPGVTFEAR